MHGPFYPALNPFVLQKLIFACQLLGFGARKPPHCCLLLEGLDQDASILLGQWPVTPLPAPERRAPRETSQVLLVPWLLISLQFVPFALLPRYIRMQPVRPVLNIQLQKHKLMCPAQRERKKKNTNTFLARGFGQQDFRRF